MIEILLIIYLVLSNKNNRSMNIIHKTKEILEGWKNYYMRKCTIEEVADVRRAICMTNTCNEYKKDIVIHCRMCGCPIEKKIRSLKSDCDKKLWVKIEDIKLLISQDLFRKVSLMPIKVEGNMRTYQHRKHKEVVLIFNTETGICTDGCSIFTYWNEVENYFKNKTGNNLYM